MLDKRNSDGQLEQVNAWLREYVAMGDPRVGRAGPVCPFMPRALTQESVQTRMRSDIDGFSESQLVDELCAEISDFGRAGPPASNSGVVLDSNIVVMPRLDAAGWRRLDAAYEQLKRLAVTSGKMVGIFHPRCDDRAVRNSEFRVSVSPVAMMAIRYMAPHDILFLHDSPRWFAEYDSRFRSYFERNRIRDPLLLSLYRKARDRYSVSTESAGMP